MLNGEYQYAVMTQSTGHTAEMPQTSMILIQHERTQHYIETPRRITAFFKRNLPVPHRIARMTMPSFGQHPRGRIHTQNAPAPCEAHMHSANRIRIPDRARPGPRTLEAFSSVQAIRPPRQALPTNGSYRNTHRKNSHRRKYCRSSYIRILF